MEDEEDIQEGQEGQEKPPEDKGKPPAKPSGDSELKRRAEKAERELNFLKRKGLSESEKAKADADDREKKAQERIDRANASLLKSELRAAGQKFGVRDFESIEALAEKANVSIDDDGNLVGAEKFLSDLKKKKPHLFSGNGATISPGGRGPSEGGEQTTNAAINERIRRMASR